MSKNKKKTRNSNSRVHVRYRVVDGPIWERKNRKTMIDTSEFYAAFIGKYIKA